MKLTAFVAALLLGTTAMAQTAQDEARMKAAAAGGPAAAAAAPAAPAWTFALHGFVSMSAAYQSGSFILSEGQQSLGSNTNASTTATIPDKNSLDFDVRQSRFNFSVKGPQVLWGATPSGVLEIDFMQGQGAGNFGDVSLLNRLRLAYSELNWGAHKLQLGQQNDIIFAMAPTSLSHIAFPLGYFTGNVGWRRPGVFGYHTFTASPDVKLEGAWEVGRSQWADASNGGAAGVTIGGPVANEPGGINRGEASGAPAVEGRVSLAYSKLLTAFVGAHWQQIDLSGYGSGSSPIGTTHSLNTTVYNAGLKVSVPMANDMGLVVQGTGFTGKNIQPLVGNFSTGTANTFRFGNQDNPDVATIGWWAQAGFNLTKEFSLWAFYGMQSIDKTDFVRASFGNNAAYENATTNVIAMYRDGGYGLSAEWINFSTKYSTLVDTTTNTITSSHTSKSDQYMVTANYFF